MAGKRIQDLRHVPGRLCFKAAGQTLDLTTAFPHGGTALGFVSQLAFRPSIVQAPVPYETLGGESGAFVQLKSTAGLSLLLRQWDREALKLLFPDTITESDGSVTLQGPGSTRSGDLADSNGVVLVFSPEDPRNDGLLLYNAVPQLLETTELRMNLSTPLETAAAFAAMRNSAANAWKMNRLDILHGYLP